MSSKNLFRLSGIADTVLKNGIGRFIPQLQRVTIKFCKNRGSSRGIREFIENDLVDFAKNNASVVVYVKPRRHRSPVIIAEYLNGERKWMSAAKFSRDEVNRWLNLLVTQSGLPEKTIKWNINTLHPSIQGPWSPFYHKTPELNTASFPNEKLSSNYKPSATEKLLEIVEEQKAELGKN